MARLYAELSLLNSAPITARRAASSFPAPSRSPHQEQPDGPLVLSRLRTRRCNPTSSIPFHIFPASFERRKSTPRDPADSPPCGKRQTRCKSPARSSVWPKPSLERAGDVQREIGRAHV